MSSSQRTAVKNAFVMVLSQHGATDLAGNVPQPQLAKYTWWLSIQYDDGDCVTYHLFRRGYRVTALDKFGRVQDTRLVCYRRLFA